MIKIGMKKLIAGIYRVGLPHCGTGELEFEYLFSDADQQRHHCPYRGREIGDQVFGFGDCCFGSVFVRTKAYAATKRKFTAENRMRFSAVSAASLAKTLTALLTEWAAIQGSRLPPP